MKQRKQQVPTASRFSPKTKNKIICVLAVGMGYGYLLSGLCQAHAVKLALLPFKHHSAQDPKVSTQASHFTETPKDKRCEVICPRPHS